MKSGVSRHKSVIVSRALCAGALPVGIWNCTTWSESERRLLSWSTAEGEAVAMHQRNIGWQFHIPTGQRTCTQGAIDQWCERLTTDIQVSQGSAATDLRWGENFNKLLFHNSFLDIAVKKLRKSVNICQSYRKNKRGTFFMAHGVLQRQYQTTNYKSYQNSIRNELN